MDELLTVEENEALNIQGKCIAMGSGVKKSNYDSFKQELRDELKKAFIGGVKKGQAQIETLQAKNDELQAQARWLVAASKKVLNREDCPMCDFGKLRNPQKLHWPDCGYLALEQALSSLPADWLERERKREAILRAADKLRWVTPPQDYLDAAYKVAIASKDLEATP